MQRIIGLSIVISASSGMSATRSLNDELEGIMSRKANAFSRCIQLGELASRALTGVTEENNEERRALVEEITRYVDQFDCTDLIANTNEKAVSNVAPGVSFNSPSSQDAVEAEAENKNPIVAPRKVIGGVGKALGKAANNVGKAVDNAVDGAGNAGLGGPGAFAKQGAAFLSGYVASKVLDAGWEYTKDVALPRMAANSQAAYVSGAIYTYDTSVAGLGWTVNPKFEIGVPVPNTKEKPARIDPPTDDRAFENSLDY